MKELTQDLRRNRTSKCSVNGLSFLVIGILGVLVAIGAWSLVSENKHLKKKLEDLQESTYERPRSLDLLNDHCVIKITNNNGLNGTNERLTRLETVQQSLVTENERLKVELAMLRSNTTSFHGFSKEEIMAQSMCASIASKKNKDGWSYAVQRECANNRPTCQQICASSYLHVQDPQTVNMRWSTLGAIHVYKNRPPTVPGTTTDLVLGAKMYWSGNYHTWTNCGPNFCCCHAALN